MYQNSVPPKIFVCAFVGENGIAPGTNIDPNGILETHFALHRRSWPIIMMMMMMMMIIIIIII